jgi:hypothetical protein
MRIVSGSFLLFLLAGTLLLPGGNFNLLRDLPAMYAHCKATEDKDLTPLDFVRDHLTCFDALVDDHPPADEQRPHSPPVDVNAVAPWFMEARPCSIGLNAPLHAMTNRFGRIVDLYHHQHSVLVFRPPVN